MKPPRARQKIVMIYANFVIRAVFVGGELCHQRLGHFRGGGLKVGGIGVCMYDVVCGVWSMACVLSVLSAVLSCAVHVLDANTFPSTPVRPPSVVD